MPLFDLFLWIKKKVFTLESLGVINQNDLSLGKNVTVTIPVSSLFQKRAKVASVMQNFNFNIPHAKDKTIFPAQREQPAGKLSVLQTSCNK